jgi:NDP-sugar pyrophosphorylase family protein
VIENEPMGTAGPIRLAKNKLDKSFLVLNGDVVTNVNFTDLILSHAKNRTIATLLLNEVEDPSRMGVAQIDGNKIVRFVEKPKIEEAPSKLINGGRYVFSKKILEFIGEGNVSLERDVFPKLIERGEMAGYVCTGPSLYWADLGTIDSLNKIQDDIKSGKVSWLK